VIRRTLTSVVAVAAVMVALGAYAAPPALAGVCSPYVVTHLAWSRSVGHTAGVLRWGAPAVHPLRYSYRVTRNGVIVGQPRVSAIGIRIRPGGTYRFAVQVVSSDGHVSPCAAVLLRVTVYQPPGAPTALALKQVTADSVTVAWPAAAPGDGPLAGYRVYRDGAVVAQTTARAYTLTNLFSSTTYQVTVRAVDSRGRVGGSSPAVLPTTLRPAPSTGKVQAFLLASTGRSFSDFQAHYMHIGIVYPTYYDCLADGSIAGTNDPLVTRWAQARAVLVMPRVNCQSPTVLHAILTDPTLRAQTLSTLVSLVSQNGYDGLNIDFESGAATDRDAFTSFVQSLATLLHSDGKWLSVCVSATYYNQMIGRAGFYDYRALGQYADYVFVMAWGYHWATSPAGSLDDIRWETTVANYVASMPLASKYILGQGMYGMDWPAGGGPSHPATALEWADVMKLASHVGATPVFDAASGSPHFSYSAAGVSHAVWYENQNSLGLRIDLAVDRGLHVGFWRLGAEDPSLWSNPLLG
jgi:spore germination protein YaaH